MLLDPLTAAVVGIVLLASFTQSTFGFGNALLAMPLLTLLLGLDLARPVVALLSTTVAFGVVLKDWRDIRFGDDWLLYTSSLVGIAFGLIWLQQAPAFLVKSLLAVVLISFALFRLLAFRPIRLETNRLSWLFGALAGLLGIAYNTYGPPVVVYGTLRGWTQQQFRANLQAFFVPTGSAILFCHWWNNNWTPTVFHYYVLGLPFVVLAVLLGRKINQTFPVERFFIVLYIILIIIGISLLGQSLWELWHHDQGTSSR